MSFSTTLPVYAFASIAPAMAVKDIRAYLCGALLESDGAAARLVATDGHRMHTIKVTQHDGVKGERQQVILPDTLVRSIIKSVTKGNQHLLVTIAVDDDGNSDARETCDSGAVILRVKLPNGGTLSSKALEGRFPDWRRVTPKSCDGVVSYYNPQYVLDAMACANVAARVKKADTYPHHFAHNGTSCGLLQVPEHGFLAVIMPLRMSSADVGMQLAEGLLD